MKIEKRGDAEKFTTIGDATRALRWVIEQLATQESGGDPTASLDAMTDDELVQNLADLHAAAHTVRTGWHNTVVTMQARGMELDGIDSMPVELPGSN